MWKQKLVIKTKSVKYMPFFLSLANFMNGVVWVIYACLQFDPYILVKFHFNPPYFLTRSIYYILKEGDNIFDYFDENRFQIVLDPYQE